VHGLPVVIRLVVTSDLSSILADLVLLVVILLPRKVSLLLSKETLIVSVIIIGVQSFPSSSCCGELVGFVFPTLLKIDKILKVDIVEDIKIVLHCKRITFFPFLVVHKVNLTGHSLFLPLSGSVDNILEVTLIVG